jgi:tetratricopeptide (TPR) repeat protein
MSDIANVLVQLRRLLNFPENAPTSLSLDELQAWKPRAEQIARARQSDAVEIVRLLRKAAADTNDPAIVAYTGWICGNIYHNLGAMKQADDAYREADALFTHMADPLSAARMSVGWVHVLGELGEGVAALQCADRAELTLRAADDASDAVRLAHLYGNRGIVHEQMGRLVEALADYRHKLAFFQALPNRTPEAVMDEALVLNDIGVIHTLLGQYNDAEIIFQQALTRLAAHADMPYVDADRTLVLMNAAWLKVQRRSPFAVVRRAFQQARASRDRLSEQSERLYFAAIELDEVNYLIRDGRWQEADSGALIMLCAKLREHGNEFEAAYAALLLAQIDYHAGRHAQALAAFAQVTADCMEKTPTLAHLGYLWQARIQRAAGAIDEAEQLLTAAIHLIEQSRQRLTLDDYRAGFLEDKLIAYQDLVDVYLAQEAYERALALSEHSKARTLAEALAAAPQDDKAPYATAPTDAPWPTSFSLAGCAAHLPPDLLAISYVEVQERTFAFLIDMKGMVTAPVDLGQRLTRADLENGLRKVQRIAHVPAPTPETISLQIRLAQDALASWWSTFLAPLQPWLAHYTTVLIAPDGLLHALPFAALFDREQQRYFCESHVILLTPSLALWPTLAASKRRKEDDAWEANALIVGNSSRDGIPGALPNTVHEANVVADLFPAPVVLLEGEATVERFLQTAPRTRLIYVAAHGEYHLAEPSASFIELADGPLRVRDILSLTLAHPIVVLNACDTSRGYLIGNEMMGLVRSFFYAGASAIVATQWQVEDAAASDLMTQLMREMLAGRSLAQALQIAQQTFLRRTGDLTVHPFFWGAVTVIGAGHRVI